VPSFAKRNTETPTIIGVSRSKTKHMMVMYMMSYHQDQKSQADRCPVGTCNL
jgi:hypothetical protein